MLRKIPCSLDWLQNETPFRAPSRFCPNFPGFMKRTTYCSWSVSGQPALSHVREGGMNQAGSLSSQRTNFSFSIVARRYLSFKRDSILSIKGCNPVKAYAGTVQSHVRSARLRESFRKEVQGFVRSVPLLLRSWALCPVQALPLESGLEWECALMKPFFGTHHRPPPC